MHRKYCSTIILIVYIMCPWPVYASGMEGIAYLFITPGIVLISYLLKYFISGPEKISIFKLPLEPFLISIFLEFLVLYVSFIYLIEYQEMLFNASVCTRFLIYLFWSIFFSVTCFLHNYFILKKWGILPSSLVRRISLIIFLGFMVPLVLFFTPLTGGIIIIFH